MKNPYSSPVVYEGEPTTENGVMARRFRSTMFHNGRHLPVWGIERTRTKKLPPPVSEDTPLYHGTASWHPYGSTQDSPLKEGDTILPGSDAGVSKTYSYNGIEHFAHATPHIGIALRYARNKNLWQRGPMYPSDSYSRVYQVTPLNIEDVTPDPNHMEEGNRLKAVRSPSGFKVVRQVPPSEFPHLSGQFFVKGDEWSDEDAK